MTNGTRRGEGSAWRPGRSLPPGKTRYPLYRRLGGPQGRSGQVRKILPPSGFDPRTVQPIASRYTDWATRPPCLEMPCHNFISVQSASKLHWNTTDHISVTVGTCCYYEISNTHLRKRKWIIQKLSCTLVCVLLQILVDLNYLRNVHRA